MIINSTKAVFKHEYIEVDDGYEALAAIEKLARLRDHQDIKNTIESDEAWGKKNQQRFLGNYKRWKFIWKLNKKFHQ